MNRPNSTNGRKRQRSAIAPVGMVAAVSMYIRWNRNRASTAGVTSRPLRHNALPVAGLEGVAAQPEAEGAGAEDDDVHGHRVRDVLGADHAGFQHGEAGLHEEDQEAGQQRPLQVDGARGRGGLPRGVVAAGRQAGSCPYAPAQGGRRIRPPPYVSPFRRAHSAKPWGVVRRPAGLASRHSTPGRLTRPARARRATSSAKSANTPAPRPAAPPGPAPRSPPAAPSPSSSAPATAVAGGRSGRSIPPYPGRPPRLSWRRRRGSGRRGCVPSRGG